MCISSNITWLYNNKITENKESKLKVCISIASYIPYQIRMTWLFIHIQDYTDMESTMITTFHKKKGRYSRNSFTDLSKI